MSPTNRKYENVSPVIFGCSSQELLDEEYNFFSDIKPLFPSEKFNFVDINLKKDPAYDLYLMSLCKHFIMSPSSMHYWGALLSNNENKICLSPPNIQNKSGYFVFSNNKDIKPDWWS